MTDEGGGTGPENREGRDDSALPDGVLRRNRALRRMLELARRIVADGRITGRDERALQAWFARNSELVSLWPANELIRRLRIVFADGEMDEGERDDLLELLREMVGEDVEGEPRYATKIEDSDEVEEGEGDDAGGDGVDGEGDRPGPTTSGEPDR